MMTKTWVDDFTDLVCKYTDAPSIAIRAVGYWVISATLGPWFKVRETSKPIAPNIFLLISGPAGLARKSTIMSYGRTVFTSAWETFYEEHGIDFDIEDKFIEEFTIEGLADNIESVLDRNRDFVLYSDEFGAWIGRSSKHRYLVGEKSILSKLYYGESFKQFLSKRGGEKGVRKIPSGIYVTMLAAMQDADLYLTELDVRMGLVRRFLLINLDIEDLNDFKPPLSQDRIDTYEKLNGLGTKIGHKMCYIYDNFIKDYGNNYKIDIFFSNEIIDNINKFATICDKMAKTKYRDSPGVMNYLSSAWEYMMKLIVLESLADPTNYPKLLGGEPIYDVHDTELYKKVYEFYRDVMNRTITLITDVSTDKSKESIRIVRDVYNNILRTIEKLGGYASASDLLIRTHIKKSDLKEYMVSLVEQGKVVAILDKVKHRTGASMKFMFFTRENLARDYLIKNPGAKVVDYTTLRDLW